MKVSYEGKRTIISEYGESYAFDCPLCNDHDKQFLVNYTFLVESEQVGRTKWIPLHCFAHGCHIKRSAQRTIERLVKSAGYREHYWLPKSRPPSPFSGR